MSGPAGGSLLPAHAALADAAASSVEPLEAAVVLETGGVNDRTARELFGTPDVFALAERTMVQAGRGRLLAEPAPARHGPTVSSPSRSTSWLLVRGALYAVPALVTLVFLPSVDPVESALVLGGLVLGWAWCYGISSTAWAHLGDRDPAGMRHFLRRALLGGALLAIVVAFLAMFAALLLTPTMQVGPPTVLLLAGQSAYLLAAATLLMTGREPLLLVALCPALVALVLQSTGWAPSGGPWWVGASVLLTVTLALVATRRAARPRQRLGAAAWTAALQHFGYGLFVAVVVLFPALHELVDEDYDALPLMVTLAALPLVLSMGVAEALLHRFRRRMTTLLAATSPTAFARSARRVLLRYELAFASALVAMSAALAGAVIGGSGTRDVRYALLAVAYVALGVGLFGAMLLNLMGRTRRVVATLGAEVAALAAFEVHAVSHPVTDTAALAWLAAVGTVGLVMYLVLARRYVSVPVSHR